MRSRIVRTTVAITIAISLMVAATQPAGAESASVVAVQPAELAGVPGSWVGLSSTTAADIADDVPVRGGSPLSVRTVAASPTLGYVVDVYENGVVLSLVPRGPVALVSEVTEVGSGTALFDEAGGLSVNAASGPASVVQYQPDAAATAAANCTVTCIGVSAVGAIFFAGVCLLTTGPFAWACAAFGVIGSTGVGAACSLESNPFNCAGGPYGGFVNPATDLQCDAAGCYIKFTINPVGRTVTWHGVGIWWQRVNYPRVYNEWTNGMYGPNQTFSGHVEFHNRFDGTPTDHVQCSTALDLSVSFWFDDGSYVGVFMRTSANGVSDNNIYKPTNPLRVCV